MYSSSFHTPITREALGPVKWGQERRLEFIEFRLRWEGQLNRKDLVDFFGISTPQASLDIARYTELAPNNLVYDRSARVYLVGSKFQPVFAIAHPQRYLNELLATACGLAEPQTSFISRQPSLAIVPIPARTLSAETLASLLKAIREQRALRVVYQSMTSPEPTERTISPHALAHDGFRWHVRAFCHVRKHFRDFVIARIISISGEESSSSSPENDQEWHSMVSLVLGPHPGLSEAHRRIIELDYGMEDGEVVLECRQALLFYVLKHLGLDATPNQHRPEAQQIILKNATEIARYSGT